MSAPGTAWWVPGTEQELVEAINLGLLVESHFLELKQEVLTGPSANKELARDVCSLSVDGGILVIGVGEGDPKPVLNPVPLNQLPERIEQVVRALVRPRLGIVTTVIPTDENPKLGYVVIQVPASPLAPHMVDHKYVGRGEKTKHYLDDSEVARLHDLRVEGLKDAERVLDWLTSRDPVPADQRQHAHFFFLARPVRGVPDLAVDVTRRRDFGSEFRALIEMADRTVTTSGPSAPLSHMVSSHQRRLDGIALSKGLTSDRQPDWTSSYPEDICEVELSESGEVRVFYGELSRQDRANFSDEVVEMLTDAWVPELTQRGVALTAQVAQRFQYTGPWFFGVVLTGIAGLTIASSARGIPQPRMVEASENQYRASSVVLGEKVQTQPGSVVLDLIGRFLRATETEVDYRDRLLPETD